MLTCMGTSSEPLLPSSLTSAGTMLPNWMMTMSPGTSSLASTLSTLPLRFTRALGASAAVSALMALSALDSSTKLQAVHTPQHT